MNAIHVLLHDYSLFLRVFSQRLFKRITMHVKQRSPFCFETMSLSYVTQDNIYLVIAQMTSFPKLKAKQLIGKLP